MNRPTENEPFRRPSPTRPDVAYGADPLQTLDFWASESAADPAPLYVHIHGGGFRRGDKNKLRTHVLEAHLPRGVHVASINYRLTDTAAFPAPMHDAARAVQFLRAQGAEWGIDTDRVAGGGPSAGGGLALWLAFHPDLADPDADDPVARESSRLQAVACDDAQSSYDPHFIREIIPGPAWTEECLLQLFRVTPETLHTPAAREQFRQASPIHFLSADAPPVFAWCWTANLPLDENLSARDGIHHPRFAEVLWERMTPLGAYCEVHYREELRHLDNDAYIRRRDLQAAEWVQQQLGLDP
jgi:acetyl esterase/lipase